MRGLGEAGRTALVECLVEGNENIRYEWTEENRGVVGTEARQEIPLLGVLAQDVGEDHSGLSKYTCTVTDAVSGEKLGESRFNALTKIKQPDLNSGEIFPEHVYNSCKSLNFNKFSFFKLNYRKMKKKLW